MTTVRAGGSWALTRSQGFVQEYNLLPSKFRSQVSRKAHDLMANPRPGGSRTPLVGYRNLCRVRAGDFRIIYGYSDTVVELMTLRRRDEATYDKLDDKEVADLKEYSVAGGAQATKPAVDWTACAERWVAPAAPRDRKLPVKITEAMLRELDVPEEFWPALLAVTTDNELQDCDSVPYECRIAVLEVVYPNERTASAEPSPPAPVVAMTDLVDSIAEASTGPIDADPAASNARDSSSPPADHSARADHLVSPPPLVIASFRSYDPMQTPYPGNTSKGIVKDAHYKVSADGKIHLIFNLGDRETALLTTDEHPHLVKLVNATKRFGGATQDGGRFVINEFRDVLVPTQTAGTVCPGRYTKDLEFKFERRLITPVAPTSIRPGDTWPGPHVGIKYTLMAGAQDIRYKRKTARGTEKEIRLSDFHEKSALAGLLKMLHEIKPRGGAIYINEARELFAPIDDGTGYKRCYLGHLGGRPWFPDPNSQ